MPRKTGEDTKIEVEVGTTFYPMAALSPVASPVADIGKKFVTLATFLSDQANLQPVVRMDGVISGLNLTPGSGYNEVEVSAGTINVKGAVVVVSADTISDLTRPTTVGQVLISAITVDDNGDISATAGTEGAPSTTRGGAGGPPFLPVDEVLVGYLNMEYYTGSASGPRVISGAELDNETKERIISPSFSVDYHDDGAENVGCIVFAAALPEIHAASAAGPGTARRNVYASYHDAVFEELPETMNFEFSEDVGTVKSRAYREKTEETSPTTINWSGSGTAYWSTPQDVLNLIKNTKRWLKYYPDVDETAFWAGRAIIKVSRSLPLEDNFTASVTLEGSGELYAKAS